MECSNIKRLLFMQIGMCLCLSACGPLQTDPIAKSESTASAPKPTVVEDRVYVVVPGDTLRGISVATTGTTQNWDIIASHNKLAYPYALRIDQKIRIPGKLLLAKPAAVVQRTPPPKPAARVRNDIPTPKKRPKAAASASTSVGQLATRTKDGPPDADTAKPATGSGWITITGSYYPREIKMKPSSGADYLMLVRPGSRIRYIARQGDWYKVITDRGEGYVQSDYVLEQQ